MIAALCGFLAGLAAVLLAEGLLGILEERADDALAVIDVPDDETPIPWQPVERLP